MNRLPLKGMLTFVSVCLFSTLLNAQTSTLTPSLATIARSAGAPGWLIFDADLKLNPYSLLDQYKAAFGLGFADEMKLESASEDELGMQHLRFAQFHQGIRIEGSEFIVHVKDGIASTGNGRIPGALLQAAFPEISAETALQLAKNEVQATTYMYENADYQALIKDVFRDPDASFEPIPELIYSTVDFDLRSNNYRLVYKLDLYTMVPDGRWWVYVDAQTGEIVKKLDMLMTMDVKGTAETKYSGTQEIMTEAIGNQFRLRETGRGGGIETYDMNMGNNISRALDFFDDDNMWDNVNPQFDEAATDAHWGSEMTYDYFINAHNRNSFDNRGSKILSYVHWDTLWFNASWNGVFARYGDGVGDPLTSIDVVAHELAHGVTGTSAGLIYRNESGALNESFSDIFGAVVEFISDSANADWLIGEDFRGGPFRSMENPRGYGDPDTYLGPSWYEGELDNGGVHINSGVQNKWFQLLVDGGTGINGIGKNYDVSSIGLDKAGKVAYRNLTVYLTPSSNHLDARMGALQSASDLYNECSDEFVQVNNAWFAVGVGAPILSDNFGVVDIEPLNSCQLTSEEEIRITLQYFGCDDIAPGTSIQVAYFIKDPLRSAVERITFPNGLQARQTFNYVFRRKADLSAPGSYSVVARTFSATDPYVLDDSSETIRVFNNVPIQEQSFDFENFVLTASVLDTIRLIPGIQGNVEISDFAGNQSPYGILIEGGDFDDYAFISGNTDPFDANQEFGGTASFCVDATEYSSLMLSFDMKQEFSRYYQDNIGFRFNTASRLRLIVGNDELARYQPLTETNDPFSKRIFDLSAYAGQQFQIVFEGRCVQSRALDPSGMGDRIYIDNINIEGTRIAASVDDNLSATTLSVFPNPATDKLNVVVESNSPSVINARLLDVQGKVVFAKALEANTGRFEGQFEVNELAKGLYLLQIDAPSGQLTRKVLVQ
ncbi:MAG: M4 family metallopeptidase [Bacteroidota bacterium]